MGGNGGSAANIIWESRRNREMGLGVGWRKGSRAATLPIKDGSTDGMHTGH